LGKDSGGSAFG